jgi:hypothetical protein
MIPGFEVRPYILQMMASCQFEAWRNLLDSFAGKPVRRRNQFVQYAGFVHGMTRLPRYAAITVTVNLIPK